MCLSASLYYIFIFSDDPHTLHNRETMYDILLTPDNTRIPVNTVFCLGRNYSEHARELGNEIPAEPIVFIKPATSVADGSGPVVLPAFSRDVHHEIELVVLTDDVPKNTLEKDAHRCIIGYGVGLDLTARDVQAAAKKNGLPWTTAKGFDGSAPVSNFIRSAGTLPPEKAELRLTVNGSVRQRCTIDAMLTPIPGIIAWLSNIFTLRRGDLIFTGTPEGVGALHAGDRITAELVDIVSFSTEVA
jgi:2-keto-4-pentenoate hydratase/2-oxohepta-3-ene-1,7-dioic acid hydratase in catechol pathway